MKTIFTVIPAVALYAALAHSLPTSRWGNLLLGTHSIVLGILLWGVVYGWIRCGTWEQERRWQFMRACVAVVIVAASHPALEIYNQYRLDSFHWDGSCQAVCHPDVYRPMDGSFPMNGCCQTTAHCELNDHCRANVRYRANSLRRTKPGGNTHAAISRPTMFPVAATATGLSSEEWPMMRVGALR